MGVTLNKKDAGASPAPAAKQHPLLTASEGAILVIPGGFNLPGSEVDLVIAEAIDVDEKTRRVTAIVSFHGIPMQQKVILVNRNTDKAKWQENVL